MNINHLNQLLKCAKAYGHEKIRVPGMSDTEHTICTFLFGHTGSSQDDAARALGLDKTTVAKALRTLEDKAFVTRRQNPDNKRKNMLYLTPAGRESIAETVDLYDRWLSGVCSCLSPEEQRQWETYCDRLLRAAQKMAGELPQQEDMK